jgi:hypothetical protein
MTCAICRMCVVPCADLSSMESILLRRKSANALPCDRTCMHLLQD